MSGPDTQEGLMRLARNQLEHGRADAAIDTLARLLGDEPGYADGHALLGMALVRRKRLHAAGIEVRQALALDAESAFAHLAVAIVATAQRRFTEAERHLLDALALEPEWDEILRQMAQLYLLWNRPQQAQERIEQALQLQAHPDSLCLQGELRLRQGRPGEAAELARRCLEVDPEMVDAVVLLGRCELALGQGRQAREHALWALQLAADDAGALALWCAVKARESLLLGLWCRFQTFVASGGNTRSILILLGLFVLYRAATILLEDGDQGDKAELLTYAWLGFCVYTWLAPAMFVRSLQKEMEEVRLHDDF